MNCDDFRQKIDAFTDGVLSPSERAAFQTHRANCTDCHSAAERAQRLGDVLQAELRTLVAATAAEQRALRENVLSQLEGAAAPARRSLRLWPLRLIGTGAALVLALLALLTLLPGDRQTVSAAAIVGRAWDAIARHQGMSGVLHWEGEWSQRYPSGDQITRTFEIWFDFEDPGRYHLTQRDANGRVSNKMVRDGVDRMWQLSHTVSADGREQVHVDEIILSPEEMQQLASWYIPSPFLDDLDRFTNVLNNVEKVAEIEVAGRSAFVLRSQLFGFGQPGDENRIDPVTSTVQLIVDAETYWVLGRTERVPGAKPEMEVTAGAVQRTHRFELLTPDQVPPQIFEFTPPPEATVHTVKGIDGYYTPSPDVIGLQEAAELTSFTLVLPSQMPGDLQPHPFFRYQGPGRAGTFGIVYLGDPGRQAFLLEYEQAQPMARAARLVTVGQKRGWLSPDPIDGRMFRLNLVEPQPDIGPDGRPWPGSVELQVWGLSVDEAVGMLASLEPFQGDGSSD